MSPVEVQVCIATPEAVPALAWGELEGSLDAQERERSGRFRAEADRRAFVLAHGLRRALLARELGVAPGTLQFSEEIDFVPRQKRPAGKAMAPHTKFASGQVSAVADRDQRAEGQREQDSDKNAKVHKTCSLLKVFLSS